MSAASVDSQRHWPGRLLDGQKAAAHPVSIDPAADGLIIIRSDGSSLHWLYPDIRRTQGVYDGEQIRLEHGTEPPVALVIGDQRFLTVLRSRAPRLVAAVHDPTRRTWRTTLTLVAAVVTLAAVGVLYQWGIPGLASIVTPYVPVAWEQRLGEAVVEELAPEEDRCPDAYRTEAIHSILRRLSAAAPASPYGEIHFHLVDQPIVNAFAAPGGHVVVFRGLLEKTETPEQLAGVLAHELQHIYKRHTTRMILEHTSTSLMLAAVSGDLTGAATIALDSARTLGALRYNRAHEEEADAEGMALLLAAGINPQGMVDFFTVLGGEPSRDRGILGYLSTHPSHLDRVQTLTGLAGPRLGQGTPLLPGLDWSSIRRACAAPRHRASS